MPRVLHNSALFSFVMQQYHNFLPMKFAIVCNDHSVVHKWSIKYSACVLFVSHKVCNY